MGTIVRDIAKSIHWVHDHIAEYGGDPKRLLVMGHSAGAQLAALVSTDERYLKAEGLSLAIIKGCVPVDGDTYDVPAIIETAETRWRVHGLPPAKYGHREKFGNDPAKHRDFSAVTHVTKDRGIPPFFILHVAGHPDTTAQALRLGNVLKDAGVPVTVFGAKETTHNKINADLGLPDDPATKKLFEFLKVEQDKAHGPPPAVKAISDRVNKFIVAKEIAGAVTLVATPDRIIHLEALGSAVLPGEAMQTDTIFWIASMSKPVLAALLLMLQDDGLLSVDDPVEKYLAEFKGLKTADGKEAKVTIRHLLTHTSGLSEITAAQARESKTLADVVPLYVAKPVAFAPGSKWVYCQSGINTAGRIAEVVTGESLPKLLERRLFGPLGMKDTTFYLTEKQLPRLARSYKRTDKGEGELEATEIGFLGGRSPTNTDRFPAPNGGLFSTAPDYARFCQMVLRGGELDGKRYLKSETVKLMTTIQTGDLKTGFTPGNGWGLGWCVIREPQGVTAMLSPGTFGHGGAYGTQAWIEPTTKRIYILMVQRANFPNSDASEVRKGFQEAASEAFSTLKSK
jgi:CubicO group peptidase (beta-lactamase class C family)